MNTLLTACILEARSPGITEQWPLMVLVPAEKAQHEVWMGYERHLREPLAAVPPGEPEMQGPARHFSSWKDVCEAMGWPYDRDKQTEDAINAAPQFVPMRPVSEVTIYKTRAVGPTTGLLENAVQYYRDHAVNGFLPKLVAVPNVAERRYANAFADSPNVDKKWVTGGILNVYRFADYDDARIFTHERRLDQAELRALLLEHIAPLAEAEEALLAEGEARFGKGARFHWTDQGKVYKWRADDSSDPIEVPGVSAESYEEWEGRYLAACRDTIGRVAIAAGFTELEPVGLYFPEGRPLDGKEALERNR